jgi:hypothetical protein
LTKAVARRRLKQIAVGALDGPPKTDSQVMLECELKGSNEMSRKRFTTEQKTRVLKFYYLLQFINYPHIEGVP